jgi:hypothetical protein
MRARDAAIPLLKAIALVVPIEDYVLIGDKFSRVITIGRYLSPRRSLLS